MNKFDGVYHYFVVENYEYENILERKCLPDDRSSETKESNYWPLNFHKSPHEALRFYHGIRHYVGSLTHNTNESKKEKAPILMAIKLDKTRMKEMGKFIRKAKTPKYTIEKSIECIKRI